MFSREFDIMNDMSVKPNSLIEPQPANKSGTATAAAVAGLASSFKDLVARVGLNLDNGLNDISGKSGITAVGDNIQAKNHADDHAPRDDDQGRDRYADRGADNRGDRDRGEPHRTDRSENEPRDQSTAHRDDHRDTPREAPDRPRDDRNNNQTAQADKPAPDDRQRDGQAQGNDGGGQDKQTAARQENSSASAQGGQNGNTQTATGALDTTVVINAVGGAVQAEQAQNNDQAKVNAAQQLAAVTADGQKRAGVHSSQAQTGQHQGQGAQNHNAQKSANVQQADSNAKANTNLQHQTAQLAQTLGQDAKLKVDVGVTQEAEILSSRPSSTLSAGSALASTNKAQGQSGQQANHQAAANPQGAAAQMAATQAQGGQAQAQNQQSGGASTQAQAGMQAATTSSSVAGGSTGVHSAGPTAAGAEQANAANSANANAGTQQSQQSQQAQQTQQTARPQQLMQSSVAEQVSVKITKALQAGQDRITIRLNPAELGRVEVKMELTLDGRTTAIVTADNRDTLDMLRRDSSDLQKALEEGGLQLSDKDMQFNLRGEEGQMAEDGEGKNGANDDDEELADGFVEQEPEIIVAHEGGVLIHGRLDVRA